MSAALVLVGLVALVGATLTLFSGFGLGTVLLPVFSLFLPVELAVAATGLVHFLNNVFKVGLLRRHVTWPLAWKFGVPGIVAAWLGASLLGWLAGLQPLARYDLGGQLFAIAPVKLVIGIPLVAFAVVELLPERRLPIVQPRYLAWGGVVSGFFGGLSGHQGALRTMFLLKAGLPTEGFVATGAAIALFIDTSRLSSYVLYFRATGLSASGPLILVACACAFVGTYLGGRVLPKVTYATVRGVVAAFLIVIGLALAAGIA